MQSHDFSPQTKAFSVLSSWFPFDYSYIGNIFLKSGLQICGFLSLSEGYSPGKSTVSQTEFTDVDM